METAPTPTITSASDAPHASTGTKPAARPSLLSSLVRSSTVAFQSIQRDVRDPSAIKRLPPIFLPRLAFWLAWLLVLGLQLTAMLFLLVFALIYYRLAQPGSETVRVVYYLPGILTLRAMALITLLVMALYIINLKRMISASFASGRIAFRSQRSTALARPASQSERGSAIGRLGARLWLAYATLFGRRGFFGIEHRYFEQVLILREGVEIASQSYQSYRLSLFVALPAVNALSCLLLLINCWSTPVIHFLIRKNTSAQRVWCLVIDVFLQFVWAIVIPIRLVSPYARAYNVVQQRFPDKFASDNAFMLGWEMQSQQVLASSIGDFLTKLTPMVSIFAACRAVGSMLEEKTSSTVAPESTEIVPSAKTTDATKWGQPREEFQPPLSERDFWLRWSNRKMSRGEKVMHAVYALWGFVAVAIQIRANRIAVKGSNESCLVQLRPWFATAPSCALVEFDCFALERSLGLATSSALARHIDTRLAAVDPLSVQFLSITHCQALTMPSKIQVMANLRGVELYNCTIVRWDPREAGLRQPYHPVLRRLSIVRCPLSELPEALLIDDLPSTLVMLNLVATNLSTLPDVVRDKWRHVRFLALEHSPLDGVPLALAQMPLGRLGLSGSNLTTLSDFPRARFEHFVVGANPLVALPADIGDLSGIAWLVFDHTNVSTLPAWLPGLRESSSVRIFADHTPYCDDNPTSTAVDCGTINPRPSGMYPILEETERRTAKLLAQQ